MSEDCGSDPEFIPSRYVVIADWELRACCASIKEANSYAEQLALKPDPVLRRKTIFIAQVLTASIRMPRK